MAELIAEGRGKRKLLGWNRRMWPDRVRDKCGCWFENEADVR
jgi:hypothetical protein